MDVALQYRTEEKRIDWDKRTKWKGLKKGKKPWLFVMFPFWRGGEWKSPIDWRTDLEKSYRRVFDEDWGNPRIESHDYLNFDSHYIDNHHIIIIILLIKIFIN